MIPCCELRYQIYEHTLFIMKPPGYNIFLMISHTFRQPTFIILHHMKYSETALATKIDTAVHTVRVRVNEERVDYTAPLHSGINNQVRQG